MDAASEKYLAQTHVRWALHIPDYVQNWVACSPLVEAGYTQLYNDSLPVLQKIVDSGYKFRILIYNGDADAGCNIFEAEYTFDELAKKNNMQRGQRSPWYYRMEKNYASELAGYQQRFIHNKGQLVIDVLTVKVSGFWNFLGIFLEIFKKFRIFREYFSEIGGIFFEIFKIFQLFGIFRAKIWEDVHLWRHKTAENIKFYLLEWKNLWNFINFLKI
ncbi:unnamed protein product [Anisakis simplex]|uniref:Uncharacterized protein n=1 Tax=Anisakis simplex TaxID=6269 RepID=A0A0M3JA16_ANISI|nr:unnamed protein product [Anisakis simplex]